MFLIPQGKEFRCPNCHGHISPKAPPACPECGTPLEKPGQGVDQRLIDDLRRQVERLTAIVDRQAKLLKECSNLLSMHHEAGFVAADWSRETTECPVCSKNHTESYPKDIFGRIEATEKARGQ